MSLVDVYARRFSGIEDYLIRNFKTDASFTYKLVAESSPLAYTSTELNVFLSTSPYHAIQSSAEPAYTSTFLQYHYENSSFNIYFHRMISVAMLNSFSSGYCTFLSLLNHLFSGFSSINFS